MAAKRAEDPPRNVVRRIRRATALVGLLGVLAALVVLPWWVPAVPQAFVAAYDAVLAPDPPRPQSVASVTPVTAVLARDAAEAAMVAPREHETGRETGPSYLTGTLSSRGQPLRVRVPRLGVDAPVRPISGQTGELVPPDDPQVLGWWQEGRPAGAPYGTTVITGHTVHTGGGALDELGTLRRGDTFTVVTPRGTIRYRVEWQRDYLTATLAAESRRLFRQELADPRVLLITCSGWNGHGYDFSAVVFARPVAETPRGTPRGAPPEGGAPREVPGSASGVVDLDREDVAVLRGDRRGHP